MQHVICFNFLQYLYKMIRMCLYYEYSPQIVREQGYLLINAILLCSVLTMEVLAYGDTHSHLCFLNLKF